MAIRNFQRALKGDIKVEGLDKIINDLERMIDEVPEAVAKTTNKVGEILKSEIKSVTNVDTGELRSSIVFRTTGKFEVTVGTPLEYAPHVNYGTKRMKGYYFMERGIDNFKDGPMKPLLEDCIKKVLK